MIRTLGPALVLALSGCSLITDSFQTNAFSGDPYPIAVDTSSGAVVIGLAQAGRDDRTAIVDVLAPVTVVDQAATADPHIDFQTVTVLGADPSGALAVPRAEFIDAQLVSLHPCGPDACTVGPIAAPREYQAILGADTLAGDALRLHLIDDTMYILPDIAGDERHRSFACDGVFVDPYRGGGTMVIGGTELVFDGRRITLQACLAPDPDANVPQSRRGTDALLVVSTGVGTSILGATAYARYQLAHPSAPALADLPDGGVVLASGPIAGKLATLPSLALVAQTSAAQRAPCRQVFAHHLLAARDCTDTDDCPCEDGTTMCGVPAIAEVAPATPIAVLVVPDDDPTLIALRTELRPDEPEVDGILGTDVLRALELDIDYPGDRVLARCAGDPTTCQVRPELYQAADRDHVNECMGTPVIQLP